MPRIERQITVNASPEQAFAYLSDITRHPEWAAHPLRIEQTSPGPVSAGATFASVGHQLGRDNQDRLTVTEFSPGEKVVYECQGDGGLIRHWVALHREGDGTAVVKGIEPVKLRFPFSALFPVLNLAGAIGRGLDGDLQRIKAKLEEGAPAPSQLAQAEEEAPQAAEEIAPESEDEPSTDED